MHVTPSTAVSHFVQIAGQIAVIILEARRAIDQAPAGADFREIEKELLTLAENGRIAADHALQIIDANPADQTLTGQREAVSMVLRDLDAVADIAEYSSNNAENPLSDHPAVKGLIQTLADSAHRRAEAVLVALCGKELFNGPSILAVAETLGAEIEIPAEATA
jgi:hypothetical protein